MRVLDSLTGLDGATIRSMSVMVDWSRLQDRLTLIGCTAVPLIDERTIDASSRTALWYRKYEL